MEIITILRRIIRFFYRLKLKNNEITLITNNCVGGVICHDLHLRFNSPTVNLFFTNNDFITFCMYLDEYIACDVHEVMEHDKKYPVGVLSGSKGDVMIYFMHYNSFQEAKFKWDERKKRINFHKIFIIMESQRDSEDNLIRFNDIPYDNKVIITDGVISSIKSSFPIKNNFYGSNYRSGKLLEYPNYGLKRYLNEFDYVYFFNTGKIRRRYV